MSWQIEMVSLVRNIINDVSGSPTYDDERLQELIVVAAQLLKKEVDFDNTYTLDITQLSISPDPTNPRDDAFISLVALKCGLLVLAAEIKTLSAQSFKIEDAHSVIDVSGAFKASKSLYDTLAKEFAQAKVACMSGNLNAIKCILTPYRIHEFGNGMSFNRYPS